MASLKVSCLSSHAPLLLFLLFLCTSLNTTLSFAAEFISFNHSLSGSQTITSLGGKFVLGFFRPGNESSHEYYIGIWYNKIPKLTPVWVANRETPISDPTSSELKISDDGNLVLLSQSKTPVWSTNLASIGTNSTVAVILDSGSLVLRDGSDPSKVFWQSFDHPTDTMLPGAKFGLNKVTGEMQRLISWKNSEDPAPGIFSFEIDPAGSSQLFILWNGTKRYWSSGYYNGRTFSSIPEMTQYRHVNFENVFNSTMNYFTYSPADERAILRLVMDLSGQTKIFLWVEEMQDWVFFSTAPIRQCDVYAVCGPFGICDETSLPFCTCMKGFHEASPTKWDLEDRSSGCVRNTLLQCGTNGSSNGEKDEFYPMPGIGLPDNTHSLAVANTEDCEFVCLNNCSCTAYSYNNGGCFQWYGDLLDMQLQPNGSNGETLYLRLAASELPNSKPMKQRAKWVVPTAVAGGGAVLALVLVLLWSPWGRQTKFGTDLSLVVFAYSDLQRMTKDFSEKLGGGGFGSVFKGMLPDSTPVAVKKLEGLLHQGEKQFRAEVSTIGTIHHVNLVRLRGFCCERTKRLLVYEYMPNGSLDSQLFNRRSVGLSWKTRYQIALGAARGLAYLHEKCRDCIIHCDVKPENILLDASFVPKVADFGLAKLVGREFSRVLTTARGTIGYLAPEWVSGCPITSKADVYSYGMMLLEIISGRRNSGQPEKEPAAYFPAMAARKVLEGDVLSLLDHRLECNADLEELDRACKIACWCIQDNEVYRPSMGQVVQVLEGVAEVNVPPIPRLVQMLEESPGSMFSSSSPSPGLPSE